MQAVWQRAAAGTCSVATVRLLSGVHGERCLQEATYFDAQVNSGAAAIARAAGVPGKLAAQPGQLHLPAVTMQTASPTADTLGEWYHLHPCGGQVLHQPFKGSVLLGGFGNTLFAQNVVGGGLCDKHSPPALDGCYPVG